MSARRCRHTPAGRALRHGPPPARQRWTSPYGPPIAQALPPGKPGRRVSAAAGGRPARGAPAARAATAMRRRRRGLRPGRVRSGRCRL